MKMVSQDRWSLVTGSVALKCVTFCKEYVVLKVVSHSSGLSRQVSLYFSTYLCPVEEPSGQVLKLVSCFSFLGSRCC